MHMLILLYLHFCIFHIKFIILHIIKISLHKYVKVIIMIINDIEIVYPAH